MKKFQIITNQTNFLPTIWVKSFMNEIINKKGLRMGTEDAIKQLDDKEFLDKLYGFTYKRCNSSYEAEDLCSDIILALIKSIHKTVYIENFYAFVWTIAHRIYADYCDKRKQQSDKVVSDSYSDEIMNIQTDLSLLHGHSFHA